MKAACYSLDRELGQWVRDGEMMAGREGGSSSLYGAAADILVTGGRNSQKDVLNSTELFKNGDLEFPLWLRSNFF